MNTAKIQYLKEVLDSANDVYLAEKSRLSSLAIKSAERYELLKPLKKVLDSANSSYVKYANAQIVNDLNKIVREEAPLRAAAARARSPWKQAKFDALKAS